jgi:DNA modification methylase
MSELELLLLGDAKETLATLADESIDALVTDPPAGIAFMGREWDRDHGGRDEMGSRVRRVSSVSACAS